ncbi:carboxymuconolactone decarboxylase family protein [Mycobacterium sp. 94-17]|uniref:carboxymuconolactone decarboxylase family protein n=1 Tax=Mycobacterium sp. 94-17 TaxID=2986147 RepID=UPI002D1EBFA6|nr:carboxymuconolactone decarboxylase family protein [Mycobacterium sp. 94-17]MEB4209295.1 carboxymuconolactone decarboxylase family protein [Mycobacterium sp. 94-17]
MTTTPMPYPDLNVLPSELREAVESRGSINVYRMVTHSPGLAPSFLTMATDMFLRNELPPKWRELAILRVGFRYRAGYETHHHVAIGRAIGLSDKAIAAAESGNTDGLDDDAATIVRLSDLLLDNHTLSEAERAEALDVFTIDQLAAFVLTVGFYQQVCNFLNVFGVTPE